MKCQVAELADLAGLAALSVQRLTEATGMTWTYANGTGWTAISGGPTTIAPL